MFKMLVGATKRTGAQRAFSSQIALAVASDTTTASQSHVDVMSLWQYANIKATEAAEKEAGEGAYLDTLKSYSAVPGAFKPLSETGSS